MAVERLVTGPGALLGVLAGEGRVVEVGRGDGGRGGEVGLVPGGAREGKRRPGGELEIRLHLLQGGRLLGQGWKVRPRGKVYRREGMRGEKG